MFKGGQKGYIMFWKCQVFHLCYTSCCLEVFKSSSKKYESTYNRWRVLFFFFLSLILYHDLYNDNIPFCSEANLGAAARIIVTIAASDEAHGIFQFSADSLTVNGTEPEEGRSTVVLQVCPSY